MKDNEYKEVIGLIPAAGHATRMGLLPCSKEMLPLGIGSLENVVKTGPKVVITYLLQRLRTANIKKVYIVLRKGKWDIPGYLDDGSAFDMNICYLMQGLPYGVPYTLDQAFPFINKSIVASGFPDIIYKANDIYIRLLKRLKKGDADVVLGLFPADHPQNADGVDVDSNGMIRRVFAKPHCARQKVVWAAAVWKPIFSDFMHEYLANIESPFERDKELQIGHIIQVAIEEGLRVAGVHVSTHPPIDVGTPENLISVMKKLRNFDD